MRQTSRDIHFRTVSSLASGFGVWVNAQASEFDLGQHLIGVDVFALDRTHDGAGFRDNDFS
jgi:hypothetical protein